MPSSYYELNAVNIDAKYPSCFCSSRHSCIARLLIFFLTHVIALAPLCSSKENPHPRISELCADTFRGFEGERIQDYQLEKAFIAVTPGHTSSPSDIVKALEGHRSEKVRAYPELLSIKNVVRGSSSKKDFKVFEALPSASPGRTGKASGGKGKVLGGTEVQREEQELSVVGVIQMIKLGEFLARRYFEQLKSVMAPPGENKNLAETTGELVHFQTLSAFLHGLLMEKQFVAANVAKVGASYCRVSGQLSSVCSAAHSALQHLRFFVEEAFRKESLLFKGSKLSDLNVAALLSEGPNELSAKEAISHISNRLCAERHHRRVERVEKKPMQVANVHIDQMFNIADSHVSYLSSSEVFQSFAKSHSLSLLSYADQWLTCFDSEAKKCRDKNDMKMVSVDPLSMLSLLTTLSLPTSQHILPAARLVIEIFHLRPSSQQEQNRTKLEYLSEHALHNEKRWSDLPDGSKHVTGVENMSEKSNTSSQYEGSQLDKKDFKSKFVRVLYNGQVVTSNISACAEEPVLNLGLCSYKSFNSLLLHALQTGFSLVKSQSKSEL